MPDARDVILKHIDAFNGRDSDADPWAADAEFTAPGAQFSGRDNVIGFIAVFQEAFPDLRLEIEHLEVFNAEDRFWIQYQTDHDATTFGALWAAFARAAVFPTLATALTGGRTDPRHSQFCDRLEAGVAARLASDPEPMQIPLAHVVLFKRPKST